jgi:hypothetical protein
MNSTRTCGRLARILTALAGVVLVGAVLACAAVPAALATPRPGPRGWLNRPHLPPGWNKHPPLPAHLHPAATGGIPGWQITVLAATVLLAAALAVIAYRMRAARQRATAAA